MSKEEFKPFVPAESNIAEFTIKSVLLGCVAGIIFGAATVYLALKAGLTVSASIPIAVLAITLGKRFFKTTILENNIIQTTGSAGESIAAGVVFTLIRYFDDDPTTQVANCEGARKFTLSRRYGLCIGITGRRKGR